MKQNQKGFGIAEILIVLVISALIIGAVFYFFSKKTRVTIDSEGQSFSFDLGVAAEKVTKSYQGKTSEYFKTTLEDSPEPLVATIIKPTTSSSDLKATCRYDKLDATVLGKKYTVCDQKHKVYIVNFDISGTWYQAIVFSESMKSELNPADVIKLIESIQAN